MYKRLKILVILLISALVSFILYESSVFLITTINTMKERELFCVTAYYVIKSKYPKEDYIDWIANFLSLKDCMVVYTSTELYQTIKSLRPDWFPLKIIVKPLEDLHLYQALTSEEWEEQERMDRELPNGHNRLLYIIWNEKSHFLHDVALFNPFHSEYFLWLDMGALRHNRFNGKFLMQSNLPAEKGILLLEINPFHEEELILENGICNTDFSKVERIGGGTIGGDLESIRKWTSYYFTVFRRYLSEGKFVGKDQNMMATVCIETDICLIVKPTSPWEGNRWFFLQDYFLGRHNQKPYRLNITENREYLTVSD